MENFPPHPFLGGLLPLAQLQQEDVPTCAHDLEKKNPTSIITVVGSSDWSDAHTCNTTERLCGHMSSAPVRTPFAAVFRGWQHCFHVISMCGWIRGKGGYLPHYKWCNDWYAVAGLVSRINTGYIVRLIQQAGYPHTDFFFFVSYTNAN